jgi:hypothetical protein
VTGAAQHVAQFVPHQFLDQLAGRPEVLTGIEFLRILESALRMPAVMARRRSVSMFTLVQPVRRAISMSASGTPAVSSPILPPYLLISMTRSLGTLEAPCSTSG